MNTSQMTGVALKGLLDRRELSNVEIMRGLLRTIQEREPDIRAYLFLRPEEELLVDPACFEALCHQLSLAPPEFRVQRGRLRNELNAFRYDVLLRTPESTPGVTW